MNKEVMTIWIFCMRIMILINKLQDEMQDMKEAVKEDLNNKELKDEDMFRIKEKVKGLGITVKYFNCQPILNMYGGMHCMTQVSRT